MARLSVPESITERLEKENGLPNLIGQSYDDGLRSIGKKLWRSTLQVAAGGFGKGIIYTGVAVLAVAAIVGLVMASAGTLSVVAAAGTVAPATALQGIFFGLGQGLHFLTASGVGLGVLGIGGVIGGFSDVRKAHNRITGEMARQEAELIKDVRHSREIERAQQPFQDNAPAADAPEKCGFCAAEAARRARPAESGISRL